MMAITEGSKKHPRRAVPQGLVMVADMMVLVMEEDQAEGVVQETVVLVVGQAAEGPVAAVVAPIRPALYARQERMFLSALASFCACCCSKKAGADARW